MAVKFALLENIRHMLMPDSDDRRLAEERSKALEVTEEYGPLLIDIGFDKTIDLPIRQLALVLLKQYVNNHWILNSNKTKDRVISDMNKLKIKEHLPHGLKDDNNKIRSGVCAAIVLIAQSDWPHFWPHLIPTLYDYIHNNCSSFGGVGALSLLQELVQDLDPEKAHILAPDVLASMITIIENSSNKFNVAERLQAINCSTFAITLIAVNATHTKDIFRSVIPKYLALYKQLLHNEKNLTFKVEVMKSITTIMHRATEDFMEYISVLLPSIWEELSATSGLYLAQVASEFVDSVEDTTVLAVTLTDYSFALFDFLQIVFTLMEKDLMELYKVLPDIMYYVISFSTINKVLENEWISKNSCYVLDDDDIYTVSLRYCAVDLLTQLELYFSKETLVLAVCQAANKHIESVSHCSLWGYEQYAYSLWWRVNEAVMYVITKMSSLFIEQYNVNAVLLSFDLRRYLIDWFKEDQNIRNNSFLFGRILMMTSSFASVLDTQEIASCVQTSAQYILSKNYTHVIAAIKSLTCYCDTLGNTPHVQIVINALPTILESLLSVWGNTDSTYLFLMLECLVSLLKLDKPYAATVESRITPICLSVFLSQCPNPLVRSIVLKLTIELAQNPSCFMSVQQQFIPHIVQILQTPPDKIYTDFPAFSLEILTNLVKVSSLPLTDIILKPTFFVATMSVVKSNDYMTLQNGCECVRTYLTVAPQQACTVLDPEGRSGLTYIMDMINHVLDPIISPLSCSRIGRLLVTLLNYCSTIVGDNVEMILRAILSKMRRSGVDDHSIIESLLTVFAHLFNTQTDEVLRFLTTVPGPMGESALSFVLFQWLGLGIRPYNSYEKRISCLGLCKLFEHCITNEDRRLDLIEVAGDLIQPLGRHHVVMRNRRIESPDRYQEVPALVRIFKLLVNELIYQMGLLSTDHGQYGISGVNPHYDFHRASEYLGMNQKNTKKPGSDPDYFFENDEKDTLYSRDPIYQLNLPKYLIEFLRSFNSSNHFVSFYGTLNDWEREALGAIGVSPQNI